jgi:hypothetical protein
MNLPIICEPLALLSSPLVFLLIQELLQINMNSQPFRSHCLKYTLQFRRIHIPIQYEKSLHHDTLGPGAMPQGPEQDILSLWSQLSL